MHNSKYWEKTEPQQTCLFHVACGSLWTRADGAVYCIHTFTLLSPALASAEHLLLNELSKLRMCYDFPIVSWG